MKGTLKSLLFYAVLLIGVILLLYMFTGDGSEPPKYDELVRLFENIGTDKETVKEFKLNSSNELTVVTTGKKKFTVILQDRDRFYEDCYQYVIVHNQEAAQEDSKLTPIQYDLEEPKVIPFWVRAVPYVILIGLFVFLFVYVLREIGGGKNGSKINSFGKSRAKIATPDTKNKVLFADVAGAEEEKEELQEIVEFLKDPAKFTKLGAKIPHGVLLMGPPGTGKTLLAKAVAGEAGVPFFSISGSDFVEMYVGVGASRVRDLFDNARKHPASIIFIDEIDAVGRHRGAGLGGGHDEREQTLNQLLVEMDGFSGNEGVIVMAATNRPDILDPALLRPGRFDREITVNYPDLKGREEILKVHARNKPFEEDVDLAVVAQSTVGFTGADLANLLNEAALLAARRNKYLIGMNDIEDATMKIVVGTQKKSWKIKDSEKRKTAYHEAGHALLAHYLPSQDPVHQISIIPSGRALGYTLNLPKEEKFNEYKQEMKERIAMLLGGRAAEQIIYGDVSGGASSDIERATSIARKMVTQYGMSDTLGPITFGSGHGEVFLGKEFGETRNYSEEIAAAIDREIHSIVTEAFDLAISLLNEHIDKLHFVAEFLVRYETMDEGQFAVAMDGDPTMEELAEMMNERRKKSQAENEEKARQLQIEAERKAAEEAKLAEEARLKAEADAASAKEAASDDTDHDDKPSLPKSGDFPGFDD